MQKILTLILAAALFTACNQTKKEAQKEVDATSAAATSKTKAESNEWEVLFDGSSFDQWTAYRSDKMAENWKIEDGAMTFYPPKERPKGTSYNIVTKKEYTNFVLSLEWKISEAGNSGIFWGVHESEKFGQPYATGPEIQVLDNLKHPDANKGGKTHQAGALYDMIAPAKDVAKAVGEWNTVEITIDHQKNHGQVIFNGEKIVEFPVHGEQWDAMVAKSKFANWEGFGKFKTGKIGLQDHGDIVSYRNIKIKEL